MLCNILYYSNLCIRKADRVRAALDLLIQAGILIPVTKTSCNGLPLGDEADDSYRKIVVLDSGLALRLLNMSLGSIQHITEAILTASETDLVNKGSLSEMIAGLEILKYSPSSLRYELFYWARQEKSSTSEVDYIEPCQGYIVPIEIKAETQGGMKSLWILMREKSLTKAFRCSLENFGQFDYTDTLADNVLRHVEIYPLYALSQLPIV